MSEYTKYTEVEQSCLAQLAAQGWTVIDQGTQLPQGAAPSLRNSFCLWWLPGTWPIRMG
jgi:type I restriction enzyme R subunit